MWFLLQFYCSPHLYVNNKTAESESMCIYKLMPFYVQTGLHNTYKIYFSMTWAALTGRCNSLCGAFFFFIDFISHCLCVFYREAKPLRHQGVVCSRTPGLATCWSLTSTWDMSWPQCHHVIMIMADWFLQRESPVLQQLLLFSPAWPRSGREGDLYVFNNTPK